MVDPAGRSDGPSDDRTGAGPDGVAIRPAASDEVLDVVRVLEGALLDVDAAAVEDRVHDGDVLVAVAVADAGASERVVGAAVVEPREERRHLEAVAVRRSRRGRGIGSALVERAIRLAAARDDADRLTASFEAELRPFYAEFGFAIERRDDRLWGERPL